MSRQDVPSTDDAAPGEAEYRALADFRSVLRRFLAFSDAAATAAGLTAQRYQALLAIRVRANTQPMSVGALANELLIKPHSAAELVNRLEAAGLVQRSIDSVDRRRVLLALTEQGEKRLAQLACAQLRELDSHRAELRGLMDALQKSSTRADPEI
jgi:DNA-binding MarR family transcriptional regulator